MLPDNRAERGKRIEDAAAEHLRAAGLAVLERNFRARRGEIDIVAREGDTIVVVEVRSKRVGAAVDAAESITPAKGRHIAHAAQAWLAARRHLDSPVRFDAVLVATDDAGGILSIEWQRDFFSLDDLG
jgi:putative endonuclease